MCMAHSRYFVSYHFNCKQNSIIKVLNFNFNNQTIH